MVKGSKKKIGIPLFQYVFSFKQYADFKKKRYGCFFVPCIPFWDKKKELMDMIDTDAEVPVFIMKSPKSFDVIKLEIILYKKCYISASDKLKPGFYWQVVYKNRSCQTKNDFIIEQCSF
ncbi:MAG: hypothetical protein ACI4VW_08685 [Acutalibacteraceae bacterium]